MNFWFKSGSSYCVETEILLQLNEMAENQTFQLQYTQTVPVVEVVVVVVVVGVGVVPKKES